MTEEYFAVIEKTNHCFVLDVIVGWGIQS